MELRYDAGFPISEPRTLSDDCAVVPGSFHHSSLVFGLRIQQIFDAELLRSTAVHQGSAQLLGGWSAEGSDRYARVAVLRIRTLQGDSLGEQETLVHIRQNAESKAVPEEMMNALLRKLETWQAHQSDRPTESWVESADLNVQPLQVHRSRRAGPTEAPRRQCHSANRSLRKQSTRGESANPADSPSRLLRVQSREEADESAPPVRLLLRTPRH